MKIIDDFFLRRKRVMLSFSSGKDSAACLRLLEPWWDRLDVVWSNMGNPYAETLEYMARIAKLVPNFHMVVGDQPGSVRERGHPVDFLPLDTTDLGRRISGIRGPLLRPYWDCCQENSWKPMDQFRRDGLYDGVIRGQKDLDSLRAPVQSGDIVDGSEYFFPLQDWTDSQVLAFVGDRLPASYHFGRKSSLECKNCTAYTKDNVGAVAYLSSRDPAAAAEVREVHTYIRAKWQEYTHFLGE